MAMSYQQFVDYALDLKNHSDFIDDNWHLFLHQNSMNDQSIKYLVKKEIQTINMSPSNLNVLDGKLLSLENIWSLVHSYFKENLALDKWNAITQKEHPYNNKPFFMLHPCQNTNILGVLEFSLSNPHEFNAIITWMSMISPLIGLKVHLSYGYKNIALA